MRRTLARMLGGLSGLVALGAIMLLAGLPPGGAGGGDLPAAQAVKVGGAPGYHAAQGRVSFYSEPFCSRCHSSPPHRRSAADRAMLNHHASRLHCLVCHGAGFVAPGELRWKEQVLWPFLGGAWLAPEREEAMRNEATRKGVCFAPGPKCADCHGREGGLLDFTALGYDPKRSARLGNLEEFLMRPPSQKWFFPPIF